MVSVIITLHHSKEKKRMKEKRDLIIISCIGSSTSSCLFWLKFVASVVSTFSSLPPTCLSTRKWHVWGEY